MELRSMGVFSSFEQFLCGAIVQVAVNSDGGLTAVHVYIFRSH